jgi:hypothetical protein
LANNGVVDQAGELTIEFVALRSSGSRTAASSDRRQLNRRRGDLPSIKAGVRGEARRRRHYG